MLHRRVYPGSPPPPDGDTGSAFCFAPGKVPAE
jgi:hypothetical protein